MAKVEVRGLQEKKGESRDRMNCAERDKAVKKEGMGSPRNAQQPKDLDAQLPGPRSLFSSLL